MVQATYVPYTYIENGKYYTSRVTSVENLVLFFLSQKKSKTMEEHQDKVAELMMRGHSDFEILKRMGVHSFERRYAYKKTFDFLTKGKFVFPRNTHDVNTRRALDDRKKNATRNRYKEYVCKGPYGT